MDSTQPGQQLIFYFDIFVEFVLYLIQCSFHTFESILFHVIICCICLSRILWKQVWKHRATSQQLRLKRSARMGAGPANRLAESDASLLQRGRAMRATPWCSKVSATWKTMLLSWELLSLIPRAGTQRSLIIGAYKL